MNEKILKNYELTKTLYEISISLFEKYNYNSLSNKLMVIDLFKDHLNSLIKMYLKNELDSSYITYLKEILLNGFNDGISPEIEEFWQIVEHENLDVKRKNNRLLNILNKKYLGTFEDKEIFYSEINSLLESKIFMQKYGNEIKELIIEFIKSQTLKLKKKAQKIYNQSIDKSGDIYELEDIIIQFDRYKDVLKIDHNELTRYKEKLLELKEKKRH